jgi:hypothetical protein
MRKVHALVLSSLRLQTGDILDYSTQRSRDDTHPDYREDLEGAVAELDHELEEVLSETIERVLGKHLVEYPDIIIEGKIAIKAFRYAKSRRDNEN